jgi:hypothetical protein
MDVHKPKWMDKLHSNPEICWRGWYFGADKVVLTYLGRLMSKETPVCLRKTQQPSTLRSTFGAGNVPTEPVLCSKPANLGAECVGSTAGQPKDMSS